MATAATLSPIDALARESTALEKEIADLNAKADAERRSLATLTDERTRLIEAIGLKKERPEKAVALAALISGAESVIAGLVALVAPKQQRLDAVLTELRHIREDRSRAEAVGEVSNILREYEAVLSRSAHAILQTAGKDLESLQGLRARLGKIAGTARMGVFPVPAPAMAAATAKRRLDTLTLEQFDPLLRLLGLVR
jgi:hypothetical protein